MSVTNPSHHSLPVWVKRGLCSADSCINLALCILGFLPGLLHAWYIISRYPEPTYEQVAQQDAEGGRVTYYYVDRSGAAGGAAAAPASQGGAPAQRGYGTVGSSAPAQGQFPGQQNGTMPGAKQYAQQQRGGVQAGSSAAKPAAEVPPTYAEAVQGDHKIQSHD